MALFRSTLSPGGKLRPPECGGINGSETCRGGGINPTIPYWQHSSCRGMAARSVMVKGLGGTIRENGCRGFESHSGTRFCDCTSCSASTFHARATNLVTELMHDESGGVAQLNPT